MSRILISSYASLAENVRRHKPSHVLTLMVEPFVETPESIPPERHLRINVHDIVEPAEGAIAPASDHISDMLAFARGWDRKDPFLVHCWAGISRSTAAASPFRAWSSNSWVSVISGHMMAVPASLSNEAIGDLPEYYTQNN